MGKINFKTISTLDTEIQKKQVEIKKPIGIKTPLSLGTNDEGFLSMNYTLKNQIKDNLKNLLSTNHGERVGQYNFGANLKELTLELASDEFDLQAMVRIKNAVSNYMPYVNLLDFESRNEESDVPSLAKITILITYSVPAANILKDMLELTMYFGA